MNQLPNPISNGNKMRVSREVFLSILMAAETACAYRFGRQAAVAWLAVFPGDLEVQLRQARFLYLEGKHGQAIPILEKLISKDPENVDALEWLAKAVEGIDVVRSRQLYWMAYVLGGSSPIVSDPPEWATDLYRLNDLIRNSNWYDAQELISAILGRIPDNGLLALLHLKVAGQVYEIEAYQQLATLYYERDPECLPFVLFLADALIDSGEDQQGVQLLHQCMTLDAAGQVLTKLWGTHHPYRSLWPEAMSIQFDLQVPAEVTEKLGWNILPKGQSPDEIEFIGENDPVESPMNDPDQSDESEVAAQAFEKSLNCTEEHEAVTKEKPSVPLPSKRVEDDLLDVEAEFERLARKLKKPGITRTDGRFPTYVIFSARKGLEKQYGAQTTSILNLEMSRLAEAIKKRTGWAVLIYYPDTDDCAKLAETSPVTELDPWKLKLSLADLDKALAKKGEMIGALLIVGGADVVPFHALPNPADDYDEKVLSDNPYATLDGNYFVPSWPVGRLPGESGSDAGLLLEQLRYLIAYHNQGLRYRANQIGGVFSPVWNTIQSLLRPLYSKPVVPNSGYSAQIWRRSSTAVFRPVGNPGQLFVSPPIHYDNVEVKRLLEPQLGYYNLHGLEDAGEWYGQRDPSESKAGTDYPVALSPKQLHKNGHAPRVIYSEACYGGNIINKNDENAICLKFLSLGTLSVVASTGIAYGAMSTPLIAADLLGNYFWQQLKAGKCVGEALMVAKIEMAREMVRRQGYLDSEDQKTLLSFVLYGDPLVSIESPHRQAKLGLRLKKQPVVKVVEEKPLTNIPGERTNQDIIALVKTHLEDYLPGFDKAEIQFSQQIMPGNGKFSADAKQICGQERYVVTFSKQVPMRKHVHRHYARVTVDPEGKLLKLAVSR